MKNNIKCVISFVAGAGIGAFGGYKIFEYKLKKLLLQTKAEEDAAEAMKEYATGLTYDESTEIAEYVSSPKSEKRDYSTKAFEKHMAPDKEPEAEKGYESNEDIDIIPEEDFDDINIAGWGVQYLTMYKDGVIENESGDIVESPMDYIGEEAYNTVLNGECTICVRNFIQKCDYKIDAVNDTYYDEMYE